MLYEPRVDELHGVEIRLASRCIDAGAEMAGIKQIIND